MPVNYTYQPRSQEQWEKRSKGSFFEGFALDTFSTFAVKKENSVRILPPTWENAGHYGLDMWVHYGVGPNNATVICLRKMRNQACPVCEAQSKAEAAGNEKAAKDFKPVRRVLVWIIDRKEEQEKQGNVKPLLWSMPQTVDRDISKVCRDRGTGQLYQIDNPYTGRDVYFDREQKGAEAQNVEYTGFQISTRESAVDEKHLEYILQNPLPTTLNWRTYDEIQSLFEGMPAPPAVTSVHQNEPAPPPQQQPAAPAASAPAPVASFTPPPPPPTQVQNAPPPPPPPAAPFVSAYTGANCSVCNQPQYTTPTGHTCVSGHENSAPARVNGNAAPPATPENQSSADRLRSQFTTKSNFQTGK